MNKPLNILHVATAISWRGGEQQAAYLIQELSHEVNATVLCSTDSKMEHFCKQHGISVFTQKKKGGFDLAYARRVKQICKKKKIDMVHLHDAHAHTAAILAAVLGNKTPLILSRRVDFPIRKNWFSSFKYNHRAIQRILCVSHTIKEITARGIKNQSKLFTVYSGIDLQKFEQRTNRLRQELGIDEKTFLIGNTSALADHKDYFTFLDAAEKVIQQGHPCHFVIIGDGPMKAEIHRYAKQKKLDGKLSFTGFRDDVPSILADLDLFLISSKTEGLGTSILDAFACKVPVVGTNGGGIAELIEHEKTGLLCEVQQVDQIQSAVIRMMSDEELRANVVQHALQKVQGFSKENTAKQTLSHYRAIQG